MFNQKLIHSVRMFKVSNGGGVVNRLVYHYTSPAGLLGILKTKEFHASSIINLSDRKEFTHTMELLSDYLIPIINDMPSDIFSHRLRILLKQIDRLFTESHIFVGSFSEEEDLLSQWRAYCPPGSGFSIGFETRNLQNVCNIQDYTFAKCVYDRDTQVDFIHSIVDLLIDEFEAAKKEEKTEHLVKSRLNRSAHFFQNIFTEIAPIIKHPKFHEEQEWRIISPLSIATSDRVDYRSNERTIVPYYKFILEYDSNDHFIESIIIGPNPHLSSAEHTVKSMLDHFGILNVKVFSSEIPYSSW